MNRHLPPFERVVQAHGIDVWRFAVSQVGRERADDVFQETMLAALAAYPSLRDPGPVAEVAEVAGGSSSPEPAGEELWSRVRALPPKQRQAVALRFVLDLEYADIGDAMRTSPEAARRNVFEALRTLRGALGPHAAGAAAVLSGEGSPSGRNTR